MRVLLTSPRAPVTLDLARRFRHFGAEVFLCDSMRFGPARFSRAKSRFFLTPPANEPQGGFIAALNEIIQKEKIDWVIPTCEEVFFLSAGKTDLKCNVFVDSLDNLRRIHNKWTFSQIATLVTGQAPETFLIESMEQLDEYRHRSKDFVFKPVYSRFACETLIRPDVKRLDKIKISTQKPWVAQQFVSGSELCTYSIAKQGKLTAHCTYQSSFRAGVGAGICFRPVDNELITQFVRKFVEHLGFTGQIGFDFIVGDKGQIWAIEGNPRATSGLHFFDQDSGLIKAILGDTDSVLNVTAGSPRMVGAAMLAFGLPSSLFTRKFGRWCQDFFKSTDLLFQWSDPLPFLGLPLTTAELCWKAIGQRTSLQQASTLDIEWNGESLNGESLNGEST